MENNTQAATDAYHPRHEATLEEFGEAVALFRTLFRKPVLLDTDRALLALHGEQGD